MDNYQETYDQYWDNRVNSAEMTAPDSFADVNEVIRKILLQNNHGRILDLGCGQGKLVRAGLQNGLEIYGMDPSDHIVEFDNTFVKNRYVVGNATKIPYEDEYFEMVVSCDVLEYIAEEDIDTVIDEIRRVTKRYAFLIISTVIDEEKKYHLCVHDRAWWENKFFAHGFRKAASFFDVNEFHSIPGEAATEKTQLVLEKIPDEAFRLYPLAKLEKEAGLHNDMSRVTGTRSDAHLMRYYWASQFIRENDRVIDAACGLGYGVSLMANHSLAKDFVGFDGSDFAIQYASKNFFGSNISFRKGFLPDCLAEYADGSVDFVSSFETLEHLKDPDSFLAEVYRIMTPGGRLVVSVPNDWSDETGEDPNPYHYQVYTLARLRNDLRKYFTIEKFFAETVDVEKDKESCKLIPANRKLDEFPIDADDIKSEWILAVVMKKPVADERIPFDDRPASQQKNANSPVVKMVNNLDNPWLKYAMEHFKYRMQNKKELISWTKEILGKKDYHHADYPLALCVTGYQMLEVQAPYDDLRKLQDHITEWLNGAAWGDDAGEMRWKISLSFLSAKLQAKLGDLLAARDTYVKVSKMDALQYAPCLANKVTEALWQAGLFSYRMDDIEQALAYWRDGVDYADKLLHVTKKQIFIDEKHPNMFNYGDGVREYMVAWDYIARCANGIHLLSMRGDYLVCTDEELLQGSFLQEINARDNEIKSMQNTIAERDRVFAIRMEELIDRTQRLEAATLELEKWKYSPRREIIKMFLPSKLRNVLGRIYKFLK